MSTRRKLTDCDFEETFPVPMVHQVDFRTVENLLRSAFEGGCDYWLLAKVLHRPQEIDCDHLFQYPLFGGCLSCLDIADEEYLGNLHLGRLRKGLELLASGKEATGRVVETFPDHWNNLITGNDDAETADVYVQLCVMGEVRYG